jgi:hypothetical protein
MAGQSRRLLRAQTSLNTVYVIRVDVLFSDDFDSLEDEVVEVSPLDEESEDDCIDPLLFVQKYINSDDILKRQRVARSLADAMRWTEGEADVEVVLRAAEQLSTDFGWVQTKITIVSLLWMDWPGVTLQNLVCVLMS